MKVRGNWISAAAMVMVTLASVAFVASQTDFADLAEAFRRMRYAVVLPFLAVLTAFYALKTWRWRLLLSPLRRFSLRELWPSLLAGFAFNNLLPAHLGEFVRMHAFARQSGLSRGAILSTIALERLFDVLAILAFLSFGLLQVDSVDETVRRGGLVFLAASIVVAVGAAWYVFDTERVLRIVRKVTEVLPEAIGGKIVGLAETGADGLNALREPRLLAAIVANSLVQWALNGLLVWLALWAFGVSISFAAACLVLAAVAFGVTLPSTPGYFGVLQGAFVLAMSGLPGFESQRSAIVAASIAYHAMQWVPVTLVGLLGFRLTGLSRSELASEASGTNADEETAAVHDGD